MKKQPLYITAVLGLSLFCPFCVGSLQAQIANNTQLKISKGTTISLSDDFNNTALGEMINDGEINVHKHWINDGKIGFTPSEQGTVHFIGTQEQVIDGDVASAEVYTRFNNITFDNNYAAVPFILTSDINVYGNVNFQNGIIDADSYNGMIVFESTSSHSNAGEKSFVDGKLKKVGNTAFEFPVGDASYYRPLLHGLSSGSSAYMAHYYLENSDPKYPHAQKQDKIKLIDNKEYWEITKENNTNKIVLSLTLNPGTTASYIYDDLAGTTIQIVRWDTVTKQWVAEGGIADQEVTMVTGEVSGQGIFALARVTAEPVEREDDLIVYNAVSANGDGKNDFFNIKGIASFPDNTVEIYNRFGILVYQAKGYNESDRVFRGEADGQASFNQGSKLPTGTYFYILKYNTGTKDKHKQGYLYLGQEN